MITRRANTYETISRLHTKRKVIPQPYLDQVYRSKLSQLNSHLSFRWNGQFGLWEIWFDNKAREPYIVLKVTNFDGSYRPVDGRVFNDIREAFCFSQDIKRNMYEMEHRAKLKREKMEADNYDSHYQMGKDVAPLMKTLVDAGTSSHGTSKTKFAGFGEGNDD